jgi:hypothetical protein
MPRFPVILFLLAPLLLTSWAPAALATESPRALVDAFLDANRSGDVDTMVMLATPQHEPTIRSQRWRDFWNGFVVKAHRGVQYYQPQGRTQKAEVLVVLEYSDAIMQRVYQRYEALPEGPDKAIYRKTIDRMGRREAAIDVIRIGDRWYWDHD